MSDETTPRRKRSRIAGFTALGLAGMLAGCGSSPTDEELSRAEWGDAQDVYAFQSVSECAADGRFNTAECTEAEQEAWNLNNQSAPKFESLSDCEDQFGINGCRSQTPFFVPLMTGFLIAQATDLDLDLKKKKNKYKYASLYKDKRDGTYYTGSGGFLYAGSGNSYKAGTKALDPPGAPRIMTRGEVSSRGGFGSRASLSGGGRSASGGGWGG